MLNDAKGSHMRLSTGCAARSKNRQVAPLRGPMSASTCIGGITCQLPSDHEVLAELPSPVGIDVSCFLRRLSPRAPAFVGTDVRRAVAHGDHRGIVKMCTGLVTVGVAMSFMQADKELAGRGPPINCQHTGTTKQQAAARATAPDRRRRRSGERSYKQASNSSASPTGTHTSSLKNLTMAGKSANSTGLNTTSRSPRPRSSSTLLRTET